MVTSVARNNLYPFTSWGRIYSYRLGLADRLQAKEVESTLPNEFKYKLQPLRIPPQWNVTYNIWFEVDPAADTMEYFNGSMMLGIASSDGRYFIDLAYQPEDKTDGLFCVTFLHSDGCKKGVAKDRLKPIGGGEFPTRLDAVQSIEEFMHYVWQNGVADSESLRFTCNPTAEGR